MSTHPSTQIMRQARQSRRSRIVKPQSVNIELCLALALNVIAWAVLIGLTS